uniref:Uncharacterized protein n=1 Tax=Anguilla anguilla TaxID=7936 RepID=A0A0E9T3K4_ANGAN
METLKNEKEIGKSATNFFLQSSLVPAIPPQEVAYLKKNNYQY